MYCFRYRLWQLNSSKPLGSFLFSRFAGWSRFVLLPSIMCMCLPASHVHFFWPHLMKLLWYHIHLVTATCTFTWCMAVVRLETVQADSYTISLWYTTATWLKTLRLDIALKLCWCDFERDAHMIVVVAHRWHRCTHTVAHTSHVVASVSVAWRQASFYIGHDSLMVSECMSSYTCIV